MMRRRSVAAALSVALGLAWAPPAQATDTTGVAAAPRVPSDDPTGGAYTSPTLLFVPAAALPAWNARAIVATELQSPADVHAGLRPGLGMELGLPAGFTVAAGTNWVGGDVNSSTGHADFNLGLSPYMQARYHILGRADGQGFQLGTSVTYKFVGFEGDPGEGELGLSAQYRERLFEAGLQGVAGKDFASTSADAEAHAYALVRPIPQLGVGVAGQVRKGIVMQPADPSYDVLGGAILSLTLGQYQIGALGGISTLGLTPSGCTGSCDPRVGGLAQLFGTARF